MLTLTLLLTSFIQSFGIYRRNQIAKTIREVTKIVQDILKEVEIQEPRFISSLNECNGHYEGLEVISPHEFEVVLYLNQMGVFNFVDDGTLPGCAVLKLSDGRKRSMSLWVEFITASGYLSARKIRSRFQTLVAQACDKIAYRDMVKVIPDTSEVKLRIRERYVVQITPGISNGFHKLVPSLPMFANYFVLLSLCSNIVRCSLSLQWPVATIGHPLADSRQHMATAEFGCRGEGRRIRSAQQRVCLASSNTIRVIFHVIDF